MQSIQRLGKSYISKQSLNSIVHIVDLEFLRRKNKDIAVINDTDILGDGDVKDDPLKDIAACIFTDTTLKELKRDMIDGVMTFVEYFENFDLQGCTNQAKSWNKHSHARLVFLHVGFIDCKRLTSKTLVDQYLENAIEAIEDKFPSADVYISAILPWKGSRKSEMIDAYNKLFEETCLKTSANFIDFSTNIYKDGKICDKFYSNTVTLNKEGAAAVGKCISEKIRSILISKMEMLPVSKESL